MTKCLRVDGYKKQNEFLRVLGVVNSLLWCQSSVSPEGLLFGSEAVPTQLCLSTMEWARSLPWAFLNKGIIPIHEHSKLMTNCLIQSPITILTIRFQYEFVAKTFRLL